MLRSTPARLAIALVALIAAAMAGFAWLVLAETDAVLIRQIAGSLAEDLATLEQEHARGGHIGLARAMAERSRRDGERIAIILDAARKSALAEPPGTGLRLAEHRGERQSYLFHFRRPQDGGRPGQAEGAERLAAGLVTRLGDGTDLVVARDIDDLRAHLAGTRHLLLAGIATLALLGLGGGLLLARLVLGRIETMNAAARAIMAGDLSRRIATSGTGDELDRLAGNLNAMLDRIEQLMAGLREVSDNIAHDLKTPLTRLRNRAEAALRTTALAPKTIATSVPPHLAEGVAEPRLRAGLEATIEAADEIIRTFEALLLIARLEAGAVAGSFETVDLARIARDVAELYEPVAEEAGLALTMDSCTADAAARGNRGLLGQALANMIDNAIKYAGSSTREPRGSAGDHSVRVVLRTFSDRVEIAVADHGPGIPPAERERVLKRFVRLDASRTQPGTGLGLSLVAAVARLHGGTVRLEDNAPGLRIVLAIPRLAVPATRA